MTFTWSPPPPPALPRLLDCGLLLCLPLAPGIEGRDPHPALRLDPPPRRADSWRGRLRPAALPGHALLVTLPLVLGPPVHAGLVLAPVDLVLGHGDQPVDG